MSRRNMSMMEIVGTIEDTQEMGQALEQSSDVQAIQRAYELLADLWKRGSLSMSLRLDGEIALEAALYAVEHPGCTPLTKTEALGLAIDRAAALVDRTDVQF